MSASVVLIQMRVCSHIIVVDPGFSRGVVARTPKKRALTYYLDKFSSPKTA